MRTNTESFQILLKPFLARGRLIKFYSVCPIYHWSTNSSWGTSSSKLIDLLQSTFSGLKFPPIGMTLVFFNIAMKSTERREVLQDFYTIVKIGSGAS